MRKHYNIMTSCDNTIAPYVAIQLTAMAYHLADAEIDFFFLHSQVSPQTIEMLEALCRKLNNGSIQFHEVPVPNAEEYQRFTQYGGQWPGEAYYALSAHLLLPDDVDEVLYLDAGDTLIVGDIAPYYDYDFLGKSLVVTASRYKVHVETLMPYTADDLGNREDMLPEILEGIFNSGSYILNLAKMRKEQRTLEDYFYLSEVLREIKGDNERTYCGDQGLLSAAFAGDVRYYGFPQIRNIWYRPYNFCLWYYDKMIELPDYTPAILHFVGTAFKPWCGLYPVSIPRFRAKEPLHSMTELKNGQEGYFFIWHEYAILTDRILSEIGFS